MSTDPLLTHKDVATVLGIHWATVLDHCKAGDWPHIKVGRYYRFEDAQVEAIKNLHRVTPAPVEPVDEANPWGVRTRGST